MILEPELLMVRSKCLPMLLAWVLWTLQWVAIWVLIQQWFLMLQRLRWTKPWFQMLLYQVPWNTEAAAVQAGVTTGLFFLVP